MLRSLTNFSLNNSSDLNVCSFSVIHNLLNVHSKIGYCPQFDALFDHLTAEEHLYFYARLKGIPELEIKNVSLSIFCFCLIICFSKKLFAAYLFNFLSFRSAKVCGWLIKKMALSRFAKQRSKTYSGGNKRKLSTAIALIGNPSLVFMVRNSFIVLQEKFVVLLYGIFIFFLFY